MRARQARWGGRLAAPLLGAPLALAFPRPGWWWLALVGLVPVLLLAMAAPSGSEAAVRAWLGGTGFFLAVNAFLVPTVGPFMVPLAMLLAVCWLPVGWLAWSLLGGAADPDPPVPGAPTGRVAQRRNRTRGCPHPPTDRAAALNPPSTNELAAPVAPQR
jgi:Apolipoprotein N-acyltransferase N-terminal domain